MDMDMSGRKDTKPASARTTKTCTAYGGHGEKKIEDAPTTERRAGERWSLSAPPSIGCQADTRVHCPLVVPGSGVTPQQVVRDGAQPSTIPQELERPLASSIAPITATRSLGPSESAKKLSAAPSAAQSATVDSMSAPLPPVAPKPTSWTAIVRAANPGEPAEPGMYLFVVDLLYYFGYEILRNSQLLTPP
jgi:hypothetical protein